MSVSPKYQASPSYAQQAERIQWIVSDVDGVMTDGGILYDSQGQETKKFHVRDGLGVKLWKLSGGKFGILTARQSEAVQRRGSELGVDFLSQGAENKWGQARDYFDKHGIPLDQVCYFGDDLTDVPVLAEVGLAACVADAADEVVAVCRLVTDRPGGYGAVRELVERILEVQGKWDSTIRSYHQNTAGT